MVNQELANIFYEMAIFFEMKEIAFKPQAYEKAAYSIETLDIDVKEIYSKGGVTALEKISGIGKGIALRIEEFINTNHIKDYENLKKEIPVDLKGLTAIEGVGPKMVKRLYEKLKIKTVSNLEKAAKSGKIKKLSGFGEKSEKKILKSLEFLKKSGARFILGFALPQIEEIVSRLKNLKETKKIEVAGSIRREKETIGDADILIVSESPEKVMDYFVKMPEVARIYAKGSTKSAIKLLNGIDIDVRVVKEKKFGAALNYFTGSKEHNIALREIAIKKGYKLNEYGLFQNQKQIAGKTEKDLYKALGLQYIEPEMRENWGEIELSRKNKLPKLIKYNDLKGDLQIQTNWTDGQNSIEEIAMAAMEIGLEYIAITDHTKTLAITGGSDEKKLLKQIKEIEQINKKFWVLGFKFRILTGAEVNILKDGTLDIKDEVLEKLDIVGAAVHSHFNLSKIDQTKRIIRAMKNPNIDIIFHPTGRIINQRPPYEIDIAAIIEAAKYTRTVLEIDAYPNRLDLKDEHIKKAIASGVKLAIDSDAHHINHLACLKFGIAQARRGWAKKSDIINAHSLNKMLSMLK